MAPLAGPPRSHENGTPSTAFSHQPLFSRQIVCTQMAKRLVRALRGGRNDVTDLHLLVADDNPIDEQFHQLTLLLEGGIGESCPHLLAESLDRGGYLGKLGALPGGGL